MADSIISHVSVPVADIAAARRFYDAVLGALGYGVVMDAGPHGVAYGSAFPEFWIGHALEGQGAPGNGVHVAFLAPDRAAVDAFHAAALAAGGTDEGAPGLRPHYDANYYGAFVRDPDGNKIEAMLIG
ncbi:VOC family protein [Sandaracinobacter neustonicus]|uniref:VOC family protein n=1 Tax=Sandaracinobacter neustonicus TaxID=1715348 RepID=UPI001F375398|nr:VOC family protein [Sandaracinobacter neustonicus]